MAVVLLTGFQCRLHPVFLVGGVGILLALQTHAHVLGILHAMLASNAGALEVASVYLHTRLVGEHLEQDAGLGGVERCANL